MPSSLARPRTALEISPSYCNAAARSITSPPWAEPKSYQLSSSTQNEVGFLATGRSGDTHRPPFFTWIPCRERYSTHESLDLIFCIIWFVVTSYCIAVFCSCVVLTPLAAVNANVMPQCVSNGGVRALPDSKFSESASTPRAHVGCIFIHSCMSGFRGTHPHCKHRLELAILQTRGVFRELVST